MPLRRMIDERAYRDSPDFSSASRIIRRQSRIIFQQQIGNICTQCHLLSFVSLAIVLT